MKLILALLVLLAVPAARAGVEIVRGNHQVSS
jgi:hypothetical protein